MSFREAQSPGHLGLSSGAFFVLAGSYGSVARSEGGFKGIVLGLSRADVEWALQAHLVPAQLVAFSPISTWVLGLSRDKLLKRMDLSEHHVSSATPILLCIWGFFALAFFLTVASFLGYALSASRVVLILLTVFLAAVAIAASVSSAVRRKGAGAAERATASPHDGLPWIPDIPLDIALWPEVAVVVLAVVLLGVLAAFVFFLVWLPILFLVISLITFGAWWRIHRATFVTAMEDRPPKLRGVGEDLLTRGAILSRTWDIHLEDATLRTATERRRSYARARRFFLFLGIASLALAGLVVGSRFLPSIEWTYMIMPTAGVAMFLFTALVATIYRLRLR